ncbi:MAG: hypothetical protein P8077_03055 [Gammaproteobacteria bacterium]
MSSRRLVAIRRFQHFVANVLAARDEPEEKIEAFGLGYFNFAKQFPALFDIMLNCRVDVTRVVEEGFGAVFSIENPLREAIRSVREKHHQPALSEYTLSILHQYAWSLTHGVVIHYRSGNFKAMTMCRLWPTSLSFDNIDDAMIICRWHAKSIVNTVLTAEDVQPMEPIEDWLAERSEMILREAS